MLAPGSLPWLVWWDLRIRLRGLGGLRFTALSWSLYGLAVLGLHGLAFAMLYPLLRKSDAAMAVAAQPLIGLGLGTALFLMLLSAIFGALRLVFSGRELSLHLGCPLPFDRILWMRVFSLTVATWSLCAVFAIPLADAGVILGHPVFLLIYPVTLLLAAFASALALMFTAAVLKLFGVGRARKVLQYLQAVVPLAIVAVNLLRPYHHDAKHGRQAGQAIEPGAWGGLLDLPIHALQGDALALVGVFSTALLSLLVARTMARRLLRAALLAPEAIAAPRRDAGRDAKRRPQFGGPVWRHVMRKEWRTLLREPRFAAALLVQPLALLPIFSFNVLRGRYEVVMTVVAATFLSGQMSQYIANLMISAEEAPALLGASPVPRGHLIAAKCVAALTPVFAVMWLPAAWLLPRDAFAAAVCLFCVCGAAFCACAVEVARPYPKPRRSFVQMRAARRRRDPLDILSVLVMQLGWAGAAWFLVSRSPIGAALVLGLVLVPFIQWWRDANRQALLGY